jgi:hypothetical protein
MNCQQNILKDVLNSIRRPVLARDDRANERQRLAPEPAQPACAFDAISRVTLAKPQVGAAWP